MRRPSRGARSLPRRTMRMLTGRPPAEASGRRTSSASLAARGALGGVLGDPGLDELAHEHGRQGIVGLETDRALARLVVLELGRVRLDGRAAHREERAVLRGRAERDQRLAVEAEGGQLVADALLGAGSGGPDRLADLL